MQRHPDRLQPEAVLSGKGAIVMLTVFFTEQFSAELISLFTGLYDLPIGVMEINMIVNGGALLLMAFFFGGFFIQNLKSFFKEFKAIYIWLPITCYFCTMFANIVIQLMLALLRGEIQDTSNNEAVLQLLSQYPVQIIILSVIIAPITEESVFRAALCRSMTASSKTWVKLTGFVLSIFFFAFFHIYQFAFFAYDASGAVYLTFNLNEFLSILVYLPMAAGLAICSYFSKNYWCSVMCHMLTNGVAVLLSLLLGNMLV